MAIIIIGERGRSALVPVTGVSCQSPPPYVMGMLMAAGYRGQDEIFPIIVIIVLLYANLDCVMKMNIVNTQE